MSSVEKFTDNVIDIDEVINGSGTELDIDLSDSLGGDSDSEMPDILISSGGPNKTENADINLSTSKDLVARPASDVTVRDSRKNLEKMRETSFLDAHDFQEKRIVHPEMQNYKILNAFREIRTKIIQKSNGRNKVIMVVSLDYDMGTTFNAVNLAVAFSYEGEKTSLLIDCDHRRKKLNSMFRQEIHHGLTDYLADSNIDTESIIYQTGIHRMRFIPIGEKVQSAGEFFSSERLKNFVLQIKKRYNDRYIVLNAPPVEVTADAAILSEVADYILFVLPYGRVSNQRLDKALKLLPKEKVIGFVINDKTGYV